MHASGDRHPVGVIYVDENLKGIIGRHYAAVEYNNELLVEVMFYGMQDRFLQEENAWITLAFRRRDIRQLKGKYTFDTNAVKIDIGELKVRKASPENKGAVFNLTEMLNNNPDAVVFVEYAVSVDKLLLFKDNKLIKRPFIASTNECPPPQLRYIKFANEPLFLNKTILICHANLLKNPIKVIGTFTILGIDKDGVAIQAVNVGNSDERLKRRILGYLLMPD
ncbi:hypothetical protein AGMMS49941_06280 [Deferribacterales bacterium]|nr:hypothetical protein AGMMS49941_06280 [Deferribacterales bacterium]